MKKKYKSGLSKSVYLSLLIYHVMIILPFILVNFLKRDTITWIGFVLLIIDVFYLLPLLFNTYYSPEETYLFVSQWPLTRLKIYYNDIFIIDTSVPSDADKKKVRRYGFLKNSVVIGYYGEDVDRKEKKVKKVKKYVVISPADYESFMITMGGNFSSAKKVAEKLEKTLKENEEKSKKKIIETVVPMVKTDKLKKKNDNLSSKENEVIVVKSAKTGKVKIIDKDDSIEEK